MEKEKKVWTTMDGCKTAWMLFIAGREYTSLLSGFKLVKR